MKKEMAGVGRFLAELVIAGMVAIISYYLLKPISEMFNMSFAVVLGVSVGRIISMDRIKKETIVGGIAGAIVAGITFFYLLEAEITEIFSLGLSLALGFGIFMLSEYVVSKRKS